MQGVEKGRPDRVWGERGQRRAQSVKMRNENENGSADVKMKAKRGARRQEKDRRGRSGREGGATKQPEIKLLYSHNRIIVPTMKGGQPQRGPVLRHEK